MAFVVIYCCWYNEKFRNGNLNGHSLQSLIICTVWIYDKIFDVLCYQMLIEESAVTDDNKFTQICVTHNYISFYYCEINMCLFIVMQIKNIQLCKKVI